MNITQMGEAIHRSNHPHRIEARETANRRRSQKEKHMKKDLKVQRAVTTELAWEPSLHFQLLWIAPERHRRSRFRVRCCAFEPALGARCAAWQRGERIGTSGRPDLQTGHSSRRHHTRE